MIVSVNHPNWLQDEMIDDSRAQIAIELFVRFNSFAVRNFIENAKVGDVMQVHNYTIEVFD